MSLFASVVSLTLPEVDPRPTRFGAVWYRMLPVIAAGLVVACFAVFGLTLRGAVAGAFCLALVVVTATDLEYRLIPNRVVGPASVVVLAGMTIAEPSLEWLLAALAASLFLFVFSLVSPQGMGMGDVKLAFLMGAGLGRGVVVALVVGCLASLVPALVIFARHGRAGRKVGFPFGPFLALGSVIALFLVSP